MLKARPHSASTQAPSHVICEGQKQLRIWNPRRNFAHSLYNFYVAAITIKGRKQVKSLDLAWKGLFRPRNSFF